jgi:hypothetical protein
MCEASTQATAESGVVDQRNSDPVLVVRLSDEEAEKREAACTSPGRLSRAHPDVAEDVRDQVQIASSNHPADAALRRLVGMLGPG